MRKNFNLNEMIDNIAKEANLSFLEKEDLLHDVNNLRGDEWLSIVEENCNEETIKDFKKCIGLNEECEEK